jgi:hypothetical protein
LPVGGVAASRPAPSNNRRNALLTGSSLTIPQFIAPEGRAISGNRLCAIPSVWSALADDGNICVSLCPSSCRVAAMAPALASHRGPAGAPNSPRLRADR